MTAMTDQPRATRALLRGTVSLPDRLVLLLFWASLVVSLTILVEQFRPVVVLPLLLVVVVATWRLVPRGVPTDRSHVSGSVVALGLVAAWLVVNVPYASRYLLVTRDPGFLTLEGIWLSNNADPDIPIGAAQLVEDAVPDFLARTGAYAATVDGLQAQGAKLLPGLLGAAGWFGGNAAVLAANLVLGALALVAVYGLSRRVVGPWFALVPLVGFGVSMPLINFSRGAYTEPLTVALVFGGLTLVWSAFHTRLWWQFALAGAMVGASALARIDGSASVIGLVAGVFLVSAAGLTGLVRRRALVGAVAATGAALLMVVLGYLDLRWHSAGYLYDLGSQFVSLTTVVVLTVAVGPLLALPRWWDPVRRFAMQHRAGLGTAAAVGVLLLGAFLASRPLWMVSHTTGMNIGAGLVEGLQAREGLPSDPDRTYDEWSVRWLAWYFSWPTVALGFTGIALLARRAIAHRDPRRFVLLAVIGAPSALYLWQVSITPDQIWAVRRLLSVTMPGILLGCAIVLAALWSYRDRWFRWLAPVGAAVLAVLPVAAWGPLFTVVELSGRLGEIETVCEAIDGRPTVTVRTTGTPYLATIRSVCDVEVVEIQKPPTQDQLARVHEVWGHDDIAVVTFAGETVPWVDDAVPPPLRTTTSTRWGLALSHVPDTVDTSVSQVWVGTIREDGLVEPLPAGG